MRDGLRRRSLRRPSAGAGAGRDRNQTEQQANRGRDHDGPARATARGATRRGRHTHARRHRSIAGRRHRLERGRRLERRREQGAKLDSRTLATVFSDRRGFGRPNGRHGDLLARRNRRHRSDRLFGRRRRRRARACDRDLVGRRRVSHPHYDRVTRRSLQPRARHEATSRRRNWARSRNTEVRRAVVIVRVGAHLQASSRWAVIFA